MELLACALLLQRGHQQPPLPLGWSGLLYAGSSLIRERFECNKATGKLRTYCPNIYSVDGGDYVQKESRKSLTSKFLKIQGLLLFSNTNGSLSDQLNIKISCLPQKRLWKPSITKIVWLFLFLHGFSCLEHEIALNEAESSSLWFFGFT